MPMIALTTTAASADDEVVSMAAAAAYRYERPRGERWCVSIGVRMYTYASGVVRPSRALTCFSGRRFR